MDVGSLFDWYEPRRARYPWRASRPDPYRVLVSEVMLQQTQAARVAPAFTSFIERFPSVASLAAAPLRDVLAAWEGLGYNRRAVALSQTARAIVRDHAGSVPSDLEALARLRGIGPYTAAAVASIAFGRPQPAIDTNVRRVVARAVLGVDGPEISAATLRQAATTVIDRSRPGDWNQAVMDLGREVCRPVPRCGLCPLERTCALRASGGRPVQRRSRRGPGFEGSMRQLRGAIVRVLRERRVATVAGLVSATGHPRGRVRLALRALHADGLVAAGPAALAGRSGGRVRLPD